MRLALCSPHNSREGEHVSQDVRQVAHGKYHDGLQNCSKHKLAALTCTLSIKKTSHKRAVEMGGRSMKMGREREDWTATSY